MAMKRIPTVASQFTELQRIGISRKIHIQHSGAVAGDDDGFGLFGVIGEVSVVAAGETLIFVIIALFLRAGLHIGGLVGTGYAVAVVIGVLVPEHDGEAGFSDFPACRIAGVFIRHGGGNRRRPLVKGIAGSGGRANVDSRAVAGVDGFYAVAAVQIEVHQIVVAVIVNFNHRAAVCRDFGRGIVEQGVEAGIVRLCKSFTDRRLGIALLCLGICQRVPVIGDVLPVVLDRKVHLCGLICNGVGLCLGGVHVNHCFVWRIAHHHGALNVLCIGAACGNLGAPRGSGLLAVFKDVVDENGIGRRRFLCRRIIYRRRVICRDGIAHGGRIPQRVRIVIALRSRFRVCIGFAVNSGHIVHNRRTVCSSCICRRDDRLPDRLCLRDNRSKGGSCRGSPAHGRIRRNLNRHGIAVGNIAHVVGQLAADLGSVAIEEVGNKAIAELQRVAACADDIRPNVAADMNLPLIAAGAGLGNRLQRHFIGSL